MLNVSSLSAGRASGPLPAVAGAFPSILLVIHPRCRLLRVPLPGYAKTRGGEDTATHDHTCTSPQGHSLKYSNGCFVSKLSTHPHGKLG